LTSAVLAVGFGVLLVRKRRQERAVDEFSEQVWQLSRESARRDASASRASPEALGHLGTAVNKLLENLEQRGARLHDREQMFQRLVETVHDAVLVHRKYILFANTRFLSLLGMSAAEVVGKPLTDFVAPEYVELVQNNLARRLAGEAAAERYEIELVGPAGEVTRVELSSTVIDSAGEPALLLTALEMLPDSTPTAGSSRPRAMVTLDAMGESVITVDAEGRIDYINHAAEALLGQPFDQVVGKSFADVASLVDETDRRSLGDPMRKALDHRRPGHDGQGAPCWCPPTAARALGGDQRDAAASDQGHRRVWCWCLHDTSELRGSPAR
jgi:PAS domain S-box-containing protein